MIHRLSNVALVVLPCILSVLPLRGQERDPIPLSQLQVVTQSVGWVDVTVEYRRPVARGRVLFGGIVPWDEEWTPSADSAAVLTVSDDVWIGDTALPAGSYSLWVIPRAGDTPWTLVVSRAARVFHSPYPEGEDLFRLALATGRATHVETLQIAFPRVAGPEADLTLQWGEVTLPVPLRITPPEG